MHDLEMDGMDVAIRVRSVTATSATRTLSSRVVLMVPGEPSQQEAEDQLLMRYSAMHQTSLLDQLRDSGQDLQALSSFFVVLRILDHYLTACVLTRFIRLGLGLLRNRQHS